MPTIPIWLDDSKYAIMYRCASSWTPMSWWQPCQVRMGRVGRCSGVACEAGVNL